MQPSKIVKLFLKADLVIGLIIVVVMWSTMGTEGMAAEFCKLTDAERCDEVEWSEEYESDLTSEPSQPEEAEGHEEKTPPRRADYKLRYGL